MDLETIIPLILVAVAYIYKAFEESAKKKKGEESAERRSTPPAPAPTRRRQVAEPRREASATRRQPVEPRREANTTRKQPVEPRREASGIPTYKTEIPKTVSEPDWWEATPVDEGNWWGGEPSFMPEPLPKPRREERKLPSKPVTQQSKPAPVRDDLKRDIETVAPSDTDVDYSDFDLEDAVIKSVILERREF